MKAHVIHEPKAVLLWGFGPGNAGFAQLESLAAQYDLVLCVLEKQDLDTEISALCQTAQVPVAGRSAPLLTAEAVPEAGPAMVISGLGMPSGALNRFLDEVAHAGLVFPLRAAVTPTSRRWTLRHLLAELAAEHQALDGNKV
jgi:hypothetical protein